MTSRQDSNREIREKVILTHETEQKVRTFRCPYIANGQQALRAVHPKSHGVFEARFQVEGNDVFYLNE